MSDVKQVLVVRKDLGMRRGKEICQGSHAAAAWLVDRVQDYIYNDGTMTGSVFSDAELQWMNGLYKKICCRVDSEEELLRLYHEAHSAGIKAHLVEDQGLTEFKGVSTRTCVAIGPDWAERIDPITKGLPLY